MKANWKKTIKKEKEMRELEPYAKVYKWIKDNLTERQKNILLFMIMHGESGRFPTAKELAAWFGVSASTIYREIKVFREKQILIKNEEGGEDLTFEKVLPGVNV